MKHQKVNKTTYEMCNIGLSNFMMTLLVAQLIKFTILKQTNIVICITRIFQNNFIVWLDIKVCIIILTILCNFASVTIYTEPEVGLYDQRILVQKNSYC